VNLHPPTTSRPGCQRRCARPPLTAPAVPPPSLPAAQAASIHELSGAVHAMVSSPGAAAAACGDLRTLSHDILELETLLTAGLQRLGAELAALEQYAEAFSTSGQGRLQPFVAAHQRGTVAVLYQRLQALAAAGGSLRGLSAVVRSLAASADASVPPELLPPPLDVRFPPPLPRGGERDTGAAAEVGTDGTRGLRHRAAAGARAGTGMTPSAPPGGVGHSRPAAGGGDGLHAVQALAVAAAQDTVDARRVEQQMAEITAMLGVVSEKLLEQQEDVQAVLDDAVTARAHVTEGNRHLREASARPSRLRDFVVALLLILTFVLWFLDYYNS
jgi:hypothetical protein